MIEGILVYSTIAFMVGVTVGIAFGVTVTKKNYEPRIPHRDCHGRFTKKESSSS